MIIALVFVGARYLVGDYSRRQLFWDGARSTTTSSSGQRRGLQCGGVAAGAQRPCGRYRHLVLGLIFALPTMRQAMRLLLGKMGVWHLPTAIIGTSPLAQEVVPVLGKQPWHWG